MMSKLSGRKGKETDEEYPSWPELVEEVKAETDDESQQLTILTERVLDVLHNRLAKKFPEKEKGIERSSETATETCSQEQEAEDYSKKGSNEKKQDRRRSKMPTLEDLDNIDDGGEWRKQAAEFEAETDDESEQPLHNRLVKESAEKKKGIKSARCQTSSLEEEEDYWMTKQKKKTQNMPQELKNKIGELGGTDVKLESTDLNPQDGRFGKKTKQVNNEFLNEAEQNRLDTEEMPKKKNGLELQKNKKPE